MKRSNLLRVIPLILIAGAVPILAQSYQTSFAGVTYDRAKTPGTFAGAVEVDAPTGAVTLALPLGPGIGRGGLRFTPMLNGRFAATLQGIMPEGGAVDSPPFLWFDAQMSYKVEAASFDSLNGSLGIVTGGGASFSPGCFDLLCSNARGGHFVSNFQLPDGSTGTIGGELPAGVSASTVLTDFSYSSSTRVGTMPGPSGTSLPTFQQIGTQGELILGLVNDVSFPAVIAQNMEDLHHPVPWVLPGRILVVRGDIAYEFLYVNPVNGHMYVRLPRTANNANGKDYEPLRSAHYLINRILNRFGEAIEFDHQPGGSVHLNGVNYTATWTKGGQPVGSGEKVSVALQSLPAVQVTSTPTLLDPRLTQYGTQRVSIQVDYTGLNHSSYLLETFPSEGGLAGIRNPDASIEDRWGFPQEGPWDHFRMNLQPLKITRVADGQAVELTYTTGIPVQYFVSSYNPTLLYQVKTPGRTVELDWEAYPWRRNDVASPEFGYGFVPAPPVNVPNYFYGVSKVTDTDTVSQTSRVTSHKRVVPQPDFRETSTGGWTSTTFYDAIVHPDKSATVHFFAPPVAGSTAVGGMDDPSIANRLQTLSFLKHVVKETRHYGQGAAWEGDLGSGSDAYQTEIYDRFDLRRVGNPSGSIQSGSVPYATRVQSLNRDTGVLVWQEHTGWDTTQQGWKSQSQLAYPPTKSLATAGWTSQALRSIGTSDAPASTYDASVALTFSSDWAHWFPSRVATATPVGRPMVTTAYNGNGTVSSSTVGTGNPSVATAFTYVAGTPLPKTVVLTGVGMDLSGSVGIKEYKYDGHGHLSSIQPKGVTWSSTQENDGLGQPTSQTDPNGKSATIDWDLAGRLKTITPQYGDLPTSISYPDALGAAVTHGSEWSESRFNGYGETVLVRRSGDTGTAHKRFVYDSLGRKTFETVWLSGDGTETDSTLAAEGTQTAYDPEGRVKSVMDPNGVVTQFTYSGLSSTATVAKSTTDEKATTFTKDAMGRLHQVTDALNQTTTYDYTPASQLWKVTQTGSGVQQIRTWGYTPLGWLNSLTQPESGTTSYPTFTVTGQPTKAVYAGLSVKTTFDSLLRPTSVISQDNPVTVNQSFAYDEPGHGASIGKLTTSQDSNVKVVRTYGDQAGRLSSLVTSLWGYGTTGTDSFTQGFGYDAYGKRTNADLDGRMLKTFYQDALGAPREVRYTGLGLNQATLASIPSFTLAGMPTGLNYGVPGASSLFGYRTDQAGLGVLTHYVQGSPSPTKQWTYKYDFAGRLITDGEDSYTYDGLDRLSTATVKHLDGITTLNQTFAYDSFGNQTSSVLSPLPTDLYGVINNFTFQGSELAALAGTNHLPTFASGVPTGAAYDAQGNLTQIYRQAGSSVGNGLALSYDALGRVTQVVDDKNLTTEKYFYTPEGLRSRIEIYKNAVLQTIRYKLYNDQRQLVSEYEAIFH